LAAAEEHVEQPEVKDERDDSKAMPMPQLDEPQIEDSASAAAEFVAREYTSKKGRVRRVANRLRDAALY